MTYDECLATVPTDVAQAIEAVTDRAGTYGADWAILQAAGELIVAAQRSEDRELPRHRTAENGERWPNEPVALSLTTPDR